METKHFLSLWIRHLLNLKCDVAAQLWHQDRYCNKWIFVLSQVVTAHAVRVAVTNNLSANITGFLPIHCIYQLLRSRAFTKHKVSIKVTWVYSSDCAVSVLLEFCPFWFFVYWLFCSVCLCSVCYILLYCNSVVALGSVLFCFLSYPVLSFCCVKIRSLLTTLNY